MWMNLFLSKILLISLLLSFAHSFAVPFHGCTFYKPRLLAHSWPGTQGTGCADFKSVYGACTIVHCGFWGCISYPGNKITGYVPDYFIEVTKKIGRSSFAESPDGAGLNSQLQFSEKYWDLNYPPVAPVVGQSGPSQTIEDSKSVYQHLSYARMITVPYSDPLWRFQGIDPPKGSSIPMCFQGISEFDPTTWNDDPVRNPDFPIATALSSISSIVCLSAVGSASQGAIASARQIINALPIPSGARIGIENQSFGPNCALPIPAWYGEAESIKTASKFLSDPTKLCMGYMGALLPRTGKVSSSDNWTASLESAYRMASLTEDHFSNGGGVQGSDKWQIVWPRVAAPYCFAPGGLNTPHEGTEASLKTVADEFPAAQGIDDMVVAVWRKRENCLEPWDQSAALDFNTSFPARKSSCDLINAMDGNP
jgi:hypothetical protein